MKRLKPFEWKVVLSKKMKVVGKQIKNVGIINLTKHEKIKLVADIMDTLEHEPLHYAIDVATWPKELSIKKHHFIINRIQEDWH